MASGAKEVESMSSETPTIEADPSWPAWAEWYAVEYAWGERWVYEREPTLSSAAPYWISKHGRKTTVGKGRKDDPFWFTSLRRIVRTPKEAAPKLTAFSELFVVFKATHLLAERLTLLGHAAYARKVLIEANVPVPALVEREATGVDKEETKDA
jgi:hypothetical protein